VAAAPGCLANDGVWLVIALQADGSAIYTRHGLWTQAREQLDVLTIVFSNRRFANPHGEHALSSAGPPGASVRRLIDIANPALDWTALARDLVVPAESAETSGRLQEGGNYRAL